MTNEQEVEIELDLAYRIGILSYEDQGWEILCEAGGMWKDPQGKIVDIDNPRNPFSELMERIVFCTAFFFGVQMSRQSSYHHRIVPSYSIQEYRSLSLRITCDENASLIQLLPEEICG